jgi:hypothetical protein
MMITLTGIPVLGAGRDSWAFIWIEPSPVMHTTVSSGRPDRGAHRGRQAEAHRPEPAGVIHGAGTCSGSTAPPTSGAGRRRCDDRVAARGLVERLDERCGLISSSSESS